MFYILSQNKESLYNMDGRIKKLGYEEKSNYKLTSKEAEEEETTRHTICVYDGCTEEVAEYETKEDCIKVLKVIAFAIKTGNGNTVCELPTQEELQTTWKECEQMLEMLKDAAGSVMDSMKELLTTDGLKELLEALKD